MPVEVNPLVLQELFFDMLTDLEQTHNSLYNDAVSKQMNIHCMKKRLDYQERLNTLLSNTATTNKHFKKKEEELGMTTVTVAERTLEERVREVIKPLRDLTPSHQWKTHVITF